MHNIAGLRDRARAKLPAPIFDYLEGGADDEWSLRRNTKAFDDYALLPSQLNNVDRLDIKTDLLGTTLQLPFFLSPTGMSRLFHHHKELGVCRAADRFGTLYSLSTMATTRLEDVAAATAGPKMFQIYMLKDRELTREFVQRCQASHYQALCLTVDTAVAGNRERDRVNGMTMPPKIRFKQALSYAGCFSWLWHLLRQPDIKLVNVAHREDALGKGAMGLIDYVNSQFDRTVTWDDVAWLVQQWGGPFVIKGIQSPEDAKRAVQVGATAVMISNHGGRQLDGTPAPVDCIAPIRQAVGDQLELIVDGGIRRGSHIVKALALGANACAIGRPYLYGLAAGGQAGVEKSLYILQQELACTMRLLGVSRVNDIQYKHLMKQ
ncbi:alpha-hydroxy-acid oxidizing enzyme [Oceanicoccus sagamiensis]|uniref:Alpha-hydroxy-acid oxidizing enzyme n=1 Tax=Oceanicoccus sagamiensis TaxID=716816 RepID=A0A1X9NH36_9GAMM|nr:alpha-hydroxy-acid oxidizing enzyme [Oceanicoccus sagamiensis]